MSTPTSGSALAPSATKSAALNYAVAIARILIGFEFFWAFIDKTFGLGFATPAAKAWIHGGSPTKGYLSAPRALEGLFKPIAGNGLVDVLFMVGLLGVGVALLLGIGVRIGAIAGSLMLLFMYLASFPMTTNPLYDEHILEIAIMAIVLTGMPWQKLSLASWWRGANESRTWLW